MCDQREPLVAAMLALLLCACPTQTYCRDEVLPDYGGREVYHCWERCLHAVCISFDDRRGQ
jgi:hypothetical protein